MTVFFNQIKMFSHSTLYLMILVPLTLQSEHNSCIPTMRTKHICFLSIDNIACEDESVIVIIDSIYGRLSKSICNYAKEYPASLHYDKTDCATSTTNILRDRCDGRNICPINGSIPESVDDPCEGIVKYWQVNYICYYPTLYAYPWQQCSNPQAGVFTKFVCENENSKILCDASQKILISTAYYGRLDKNICRPTNWENKLTQISNTNCKQDLGNYYKLQCDYKQSCIIHANNNIKGDPCVGIYKYAEIQYSCVN